MSRVEDVKEIFHPFAFFSVVQHDWDNRKNHDPLS